MSFKYLLAIEVSTKIKEPIRCDTLKIITRIRIMVSIAGGNLALDMTQHIYYLDPDVIEGETYYESRDDFEAVIEYATDDLYIKIQAVMTGDNLLNEDPLRYIDSFSIKSVYRRKDYTGYGFNSTDTRITYSDLDNRFTFNDLMNLPFLGWNDKSITGSDGKSLLQGNDYVVGTSQDDNITGQVGADTLEGGAGSDTIWGGNGVDQITGGPGSDTMYGGFGPNTFFALNDGYVDNIYLKSDQFAYNWFYGKAGNSPTGRKADYLFDVEKHDRVIIQGVPTSALVVEYGNPYTKVSAYGWVEAYLDTGSLTRSQVNKMDISGDLVFSSDSPSY